MVGEDHWAAYFSKPTPMPWHANKILPIWIGCGNRFVIHGWRKVGERGARKVWKCRKVWLQRNEGTLGFWEAE
jgi:hypothetical protein